MKPFVRVLSAVLMSVGIALAIWWLYPDPRDLPPVLAELPAIAERNEGEGLRDARGGLREPLAFSIEVRSQGGEALTEADVGMATVVLRGSISASADTVMRADPAGLVHLDERSLDRDLLVRCRGYSARVVHFDAAGRHRVELAAAASLEVRCQSAQGPVSDASVFVTLNQPMTAAAAQNLSEDASGDPRSERPIWMGQTDAGGVCHFDLPPDRACGIAVFHDAMYPVEEWALGDRESPTNSGTLVVNLRDMYGIAVALPTTADCQSHFWRYDHRQRSLDLGVVARMRYCSDRLARRFPGLKCLAVGPADAGVPFVVDFAAMAADGSEWGLEWALVPIRELKQPVYAERVENAGVASLHCRLMVAGAAVPGTPMRLVKQGRKGLPLVFNITSGTTLTVPSGKYALETAVPLAFGDELPDPGLQEVAAGSIATIELAIPYRAVQCRLQLSVEDDVLNRAVAVSLQGPEGSLNAVRRQEDGPLVVWVPPGNYQLRAHAQGYQVLERELVVPEDAAQVAFDDLVVRR